MSAINSALSQLAKDKSMNAQELVKADVKPLKQRAILPWVVGSFGLSLAVGGWAISQQAPQTETSLVVAPIAPEISAIDEVDVTSPTSKTLSSEPQVFQANTLRKVSQTIEPAKAVKPAVVQSTPNISKPVLVAKVETPHKASPKSPEVAAKQGEVVIEQVELTPEQLSLKAQERARKALDSNNLADALSSYNEALRYTPSNTDVRKRLSALYYGKGEVRKAADTLQKGIVLNSNDSELRVSLAKMLMKEKQNEVALTVLSAMPESASIEYLSLRAALAQKAKQDDLALQSYSALVEQEPESGRWWLGLAIQQERAFDLSAAKNSYQQAITKLGLSSQSQQFIRDRLALISSLEEQSSEN
ncbi:MSHA biogenesis protein MshN [Vibrio sp. RE86]|uniref:tetratricopeptide repeat protein n=1 Tax=Vibrio sp. RE86 TaxID=2607605 RepID=UPI00149361EF|nr:tetratricopeptide repeat protein [Vibrio sp. RE86]NOH80949.1 MSHA biogenesis protein MshN [Vibrio sp. RE86]